MRARSLLAVPFLTLALPAQVGSSVTALDVGLTMQTGSPTSPVNNIAGQVCSAFTCTPFVSPTTTATVSPLRTLRAYGDANSLYALLISTSPTLQPCLPIPGIANALILDQPIVAFAIGVTGPYVPSTSAVCQQGVGVYQLMLPPVSPAVIPFRIQALTYSHMTQGLAFTIAIEGHAF